MKMDDSDFINCTEKLAALLLKHRQTVAVAESCTGGWIAKVLTDLSGSSAWFERGFVTYSNRSKQDMLGVSESTLQSYGAVSSETVEAMAAGVLQNSMADFSLSVSGIAGPTGGTTEKPVGLVWFAWAAKEHEQSVLLATEKQVFKGDRDAVRHQAVAYALNRLVELLETSYEKDRD
jgi:nicotinamide-nucleotide amidase